MPVTKVGNILSLFISKVANSNRLSEKQITVDNKGILNDKFYDKDIHRSILITSLDSYKLALAHDINIKHGSLGENILIDYNPYKLPSGSRLNIGEVVLEISQNCTICNHLSHIDKKLPKLLRHDRGIFAKVVKGGIINVDDVVILLDEV